MRLREFFPHTRWVWNEEDEYDAHKDLEFWEVTVDDGIVSDLKYPILKHFKKHCIFYRNLKVENDLTFQLVKSLPKKMAQQTQSSPVIIIQGRLLSCCKEGSIDCGLFQDKLT